MSNPFGKFPWTLPMEQKKIPIFRIGIVCNIFILFKNLHNKPDSTVKKQLKEKHD
jgi:hypothetical protein